MIRAGEPSESPSERTVHLGRPALTIGVAVAAVVLVALAATGDRVPLATEGSGGRYVDRRTTFAEPRESGAAEPTDVPNRSQLPGDGVVAVLAQTAVIVVVAIALGMALGALLRVSRRAPPSTDLAPDEHWPEPARELVGAVDDGLVALRGGPVDDVVVACWVRLEDAAAAAGIPRRAAETPAELASRVLVDLHAPGAAVDGLLQRYRLARFSHHPLDEDDRAAAVRSLQEIRAAIAGAPT